jgi:hypothetical protein
MSDPQTTMDGPHTYKPDVPFYDWTVLTATDVDGVRYWFHVPTASLALEELAASLAPRIISGGPDPQTRATDWKPDVLGQYQTPATEAGRLRDLLDNRQMPDHATPAITLGELRALRDAIEAEARASLDVERWRLTYDPDHDDRSFIDGWNAALDAILAEQKP